MFEEQFIQLFQQNLLLIDNQMDLDTDNMLFDEYLDEDEMEYEDDYD